MVLILSSPNSVRPSHVLILFEMCDFENVIISLYLAPVIMTNLCTHFLLLLYIDPLASSSGRRGGSSKGGGGGGGGSATHDYLVDIFAGFRSSKSANRTTLIPSECHTLHMPRVSQRHTMVILYHKR